MKVEEKTAELYLETHKKIEEDYLKRMESLDNTLIQKYTNIKVGDKVAIMDCGFRGKPYRKEITVRRFEVKKEIYCNEAKNFTKVTIKIVSQDNRYYDLSSVTE